ncbi:unnamed protein product, partial [Prorocentrum cordatum]
TCLRPAGRQVSRRFVLDVQPEWRKLAGCQSCREPLGVGELRRHRGEVRRRCRGNAAPGRRQPRRRRFLRRRSAGGRPADRPPRHVGPWALRREHPAQLRLAGPRGCRA